jgi:serine protease AprX
MRKFRVLLASIATCALLGPTLGPSAASASTATPMVSLDSTQKIHPLLQYGADVNPTSLVRVIVQTTTNNASAKSIASQIAGMQVNEQFKVIPAFVATLPQGSVSSLAQNADVRYVSPDGPVLVQPGAPPTAGPVMPPAYGRKPAAKFSTPYTPASLQTIFPIETGAAGAWTGAGLTGNGINVAVIDTGIDATHPELTGQVIAVNVNNNTLSSGDGYGHGTHVAGIINGHAGTRDYLGIAPNSIVVSVKVSDDSGRAYESDLLRGLDWVDQNRSTDKIQVLNLSVTTSVPASYATSPIDAAVERLWHDNVTVVVAAGNLGSAQDAVWYAPANDPMVITVGCLDDNQTTSPTDDSVCPISSRGVTEDGFAKPDLVAPGRKIVSAMARELSGQAIVLSSEFPDRLSTNGLYIRLSGTSMAAPQVSGAIALTLQRHSKLTPDQIKNILTRSARPYAGQADAAGALDIGAALLASDYPTAIPQVLLPVGGTPPPAGSSSVLWDGSRWTSMYWDGSRWTSTYWDGSRWGSAEWDGSRWTSAYWDGSRWGSSYWDGSRWGGSAWDSGSYD